MASFKLKLHLPTVFFALVLNVLLDNLLVSTDSRGKVANRPDAHLAVVDVFEKGKLACHEPSGITLEDSYGLGYRHLWCNAYKQMNVVLVGIALYDLGLGMASLDCEHDRLHVSGHTALAEYLPAELRGEDEVVSRVVDRMRLSVILHASVLAHMG